MITCLQLTTAMWDATCLYMLTDSHHNSIAGWASVEWCRQLLTLSPSCPFGGWGRRAAHTGVALPGLPFTITVARLSGESRMPRSHRPPFTVTVARLSGESRAFYPVQRRHSVRHFIEWVEAEMGLRGRRYKLLLGEMELNPERVGLNYEVATLMEEPHFGHIRVRRVEMRRYLIYEDTTLTLVLM